MATESTTSTPAQAWANPTAAGLVGLAVACFAHFANLSGYVTTAALPLFGAWLIGGFVVQLLVAVLDLRGGNTAGGNTFLFFSAFFMLAGGIEMIFKYNAIQDGAPLDGRIDGWAWLVLWLVLWLWTPAFFKKFNILSLVIVALDVALPFISLIDLTVLPASFKPVPAYALLAAGVLGIYLSATLVVNTTYGRNVLPVIGGK
ncbi:MAG: hypothetical protein LBI33_12725 [Propionibacteriaceae bacterium]|nr:hypothetical protein [Propionibacteriaceae bacterium]